MPKSQYSDIDFNGVGRVVNLAPPIATGDATNKQYVDQTTATAETNSSKRSRVKAASAGASVVISSITPGTILDGVTLNQYDLILLKDQTNAAQNGVYQVDYTTARFVEYSAWDQFPASLIGVAMGATNNDTLWVCTSDFGGTLGTTAITFVSFGTAAGMGSMSNQNSNNVNITGGSITNTALADNAWTHSFSPLFDLWKSSKYTASYYSGGQIQVPADLRVPLLIGQPIRYYQLGQYWYGYVSAYSYTAPNTIISIISNSSVANSPITDWGISYGMPPDMPSSFAYTPTFPAGFSTPPSGTNDRFTIIGGWCTYTLRQTTAGVSNANTFQISLPINVGNVSGRWTGPCAVIDNGTLQAAPGMLACGPNSTFVNVFKDFTSTNIFTTTGNKRCDGGTIVYPVR